MSPCPVPAPLCCHLDCASSASGLSQLVTLLLGVAMDRGTLRSFPSLAWAYICVENFCEQVGKTQDFSVCSHSAAQSELLLPLIRTVCANILVFCRRNIGVRASLDKLELLLLTSVVPEHEGASVLCSRPAGRFQDTKIRFGKHPSLGRSATGRGSLWVGWIPLPVPIPVSQSRQQGR